MTLSGKEVICPFRCNVTRKVTLNQECQYQSFSFDSERERKALPFYPRSNRKERLCPFILGKERKALPFYPRKERLCPFILGKERLCPFILGQGLVFVTKPSRKQNLFFQNKFIKWSCVGCLSLAGTPLRNQKVRRKNFSSVR